MLEALEPQGGNRVGPRMLVSMGTEILSELGVNGRSIIQSNPPVGGLATPRHADDTGLSPPLDGGEVLAGRTIGHVAHPDPVRFPPGPHGAGLAHPQERRIGPIQFGGRTSRTITETFR